VPFPGGDDRPFVEAANSCSTRTVRRHDGWRPIQTTSGPLLLNARRPNSTFARQSSENAQNSITAAHASSSTDAAENPLRAPQYRPTPAEVLVGDHMVSSGRLAPRDWKEQDKEQDSFCAVLGELDRKKDENAGAPQMIENGSLFVISPTCHNA
jgi:hypothetical protein